MNVLPVDVLFLGQGNQNAIDGQRLLTGDQSPVRTKASPGLPVEDGHCERAFGRIEVERNVSISCLSRPRHTRQG
jgi:hypothetical protein